MPTIETHRKQAKLLLRWHCEGNYSIGEKVRLLERHRHLTDREALDMAMPLALAQEIVAVEAGFANWAALKNGAGEATRPPEPEAPELKAAVPILFVRDVAASAAFYADKLGFAVDFLHGKPPFYGSISRGAACLHLRFVHAPNFAELAGREPSLILATIEAGNVKTLFETYKAAGVDFAQALVKQAWGGTDFHVRDPDGNVISFVQYRTG
jgi:catechol 2,3-dioxygenase-like lactoylglutathione lyase family enzyme